MMRNSGVSYYLYPNGWFRIYQRVEKCEDSLSKDYIILGDSVADQIYPFSSSNGYFTTNAAVLTAGNYILAARLLENHPNITRIYYVAVPQVIGLKFERDQTCHNFIKPFLTDRNREYFDTYLLEKTLQRESFSLWV